MRTELAGNLKKRFNALASSIVLVCRKRPSDAPSSSPAGNSWHGSVRRLPDALAKIRKGGVGPVDMAQAAIGPGMGVFTAASRVLEADDSPMSVRTAIALINQVRDEISGEEATGYDARHPLLHRLVRDLRHAGRAIPVRQSLIAQAYGIGIGDLETAGVFSAKGGAARLLRRDELPAGWDPTTDKRLTDWECAQHLARVLDSPEGGIEAAARLVARMESGAGGRRAPARLPPLRYLRAQGPRGRGPGLEHARPRMAGARSRGGGDRNRRRRAFIAVGDGECRSPYLSATVRAAPLN